MKKMITIVLAAVLMLSCMAGVALAAEPGDTVTVEFYAVNNPGFASFGAVINYDASALELTSISAGSLCSGGMFMPNPANGQVAYINGTDITGDGLLFTATFNVKADAAPGTYAVTAAVDAPENAAGESINLVISGGEVVVEKPVCEHTWDDGVVTTPATCEEDGVKTYTCTKCGETKTESVPAIGHAWDDGVVTTEATCEEDGVLTYTCANCGETKTESIPAIGHAWDDGVVTTEATCEEEGVLTYTCANCGETKTESIPAKGHNSGETLVYEYDEEFHWTVCECGQHGEKEAHSFDYNGMCKCGYQNPNHGGGGNDDDEPTTGDITPVIALGVFGMMAMAATVVAATKRKNVK